MVPNNHNPILEGGVCVRGRLGVCEGEIRSLGGGQEFKVIISYSKSQVSLDYMRPSQKQNTRKNSSFFFFCALQ